MLSSPEAARFVLVTRAHLFKPTYPKSKEKMIGPSALFFHQGEYHSQLRKLVQSSLSPESIRKLVPSIEILAVSALESWAGGQVINTFHAMKKVCFCLDSNITVICFHCHYEYSNLILFQRPVTVSIMLCMFLLFSFIILLLSSWPFSSWAVILLSYSSFLLICHLSRYALLHGFCLQISDHHFSYWFLQFSFDVGILSVFGHLEGNYREKLTKNYSIVDKGYNSFPTNIPGTAYSKAILVSSLEHTT